MPEERVEVDKCKGNIRNAAQITIDDGRPTLSFDLGSGKTIIQSLHPIVADEVNKVEVTLTDNVGTLAVNSAGQQV